MLSAGWQVQKLVTGRRAREGLAKAARGRMWVLRSSKEESLSRSACQRICRNGTATLDHLGQLCAFCRHCCLSSGQPDVPIRQRRPAKAMSRIVLGVSATSAVRPDAQHFLKFANLLCGLSPSKTVHSWLLQALINTTRNIRRAQLPQLISQQPTSACSCRDRH